MKEEIVYDGWLKVYKREVEGRGYDILKNYSAVAVFLLNEFEEVLMVKQFRPALMMETMEIPAGVLDMKDEPVEECAIREMREETGITIESSSLERIVSYKPMMGFSDSTMHIFLGKVNKSEAILNSKLEDDEVSEAFWMPLEELRLSIQDGKVFDGKTLMAYYYYLSNKK